MLRTNAVRRARHGCRDDARPSRAPPPYPCCMRLIVLVLVLSSLVPSDLRGHVGDPAPRHRGPDPQGVPRLGTDGRRKTGDGRRRTGDGRRRTGDGRRRTEDGRRRTEDGRRRQTDDRRQKTEGARRRRRKTETDRRQKTEDGRREAEKTEQTETETETDRRWRQRKAIVSVTVPPPPALPPSPRPPAPPPPPPPAAALLSALPLLLPPPSATTSSSCSSGAASSSASLFHSRWKDGGGVGPRDGTPPPATGRNGPRSEIGQSAGWSIDLRCQEAVMGSVSPCVWGFRHGLLMMMN